MFLDMQESLLFHILQGTNYPIIKHRSSFCDDKHKHQIIPTYDGPYHSTIHHRHLPRTQISPTISYETHSILKTQSISISQKEK